MAAEQAIRAALKVASTLFSGRGSDNGGGKGGRGMLAAAGIMAFIPLVAVYVIISSPLGAWALLFGDDSSTDYQTGETMTYGLYDFDVDGDRVSWYMDEASELSRWAKSRWQTGRGDIYSTPDWRYLYAFDMALSENDFGLVRDNEDYYRELHHGLLSATSVSHSYRVGCEEGETGEYYDEERGVYYNIERYTTWTVNTKDFNSFFKKRVFNGDISEDFLYFANYESGDWGAEGGWGDQGNAIGGLQFDRRYALDDFLSYAINECPGEYDYLATYAAMNVIPQSDEGLLEGWRRAYAKDPDKWVQLQVEFEYESYYAPGENALADLGFDCSGRPDAIKGLVASLCNLNGVGGAKRYFAAANLDNSMTDKQVAEAIAYAFINNPPQPYPQAYANRYTNELAVVLDLLESGSTTSGEAATHLGDNPDAEGRNLALDQKGELASNYRRSLYAVAVYYDDYDVLIAEIDADKFTRIVSMGEEVRGLDTATTEEGKRIIEACKTVDSPGENLCATWITWVYKAAGCGSPGGNACDMWSKYCNSTDRADLSPGMIVASPHSSGSGPGWTYGHVAIYIGEVDGVPTVMDSIGYVRTMPLDSWIAENDYTGETAWGWAL